MLTVGITGGIGSGKSTVCKVFRVLGVPVFQADTVARNLQNEDPLIQSGLTDIFGPGIYDSYGNLNRKKIAEIIFNDKLLLDKVNNLIHPAVHLEFEKWKKSKSTFPYVLYEAAILFETGSYRSFDYVIMVMTEEKERIARVMERDSVSEEAIKQRMLFQMPDTQKIKLADFVIENNDNQMIIPKILELNKILNTKSHVR
jgi:dephospho-CoA kinase